MNLDGKEINYIFIFHSSPTKYSISFNCECNAVVLAAPVTCDQWTSQIFSNSVTCGYCRSLKISLMLSTASK